MGGRRGSSRGHEAKPNSKGCGKGKRRQGMKGGKGVVEGKQGKERWRGEGKRVGTSCHPACGGKKRRFLRENHRS